MRRIIILSALWIAASLAFAQQGKSSTAATDSSHLFIDNEENAKFPGGEQAYFKWLSDNIKYPKDCLKEKVEGRVIVNFTIEKDGSITDVKTWKSPHSSLSKEAERLVKAMPKWKPARYMDEPIRQRFTLPIVFRLGEDGKVKK